MLKLKKLYTESGKLRPYRESRNGVEYFYFEDPFNKIVIRQIMPTKLDTDKILKVLPDLDRKVISREIKKIKEESKDLIFIIEEPNQFLGYAKTKALDEYCEKADIEIHFVNETVKSLYLEKVKETLKYMCKRTWKYRHLYYKTAISKKQIV